MDPLSNWIIDRRETIKELRKLANSLQSHAKKAKIASVVGGGTGIVAGVGAAVCYFIAPFTFGGSLIPATALTGIAIAGGATSVGSSVTNFFIEKGYMKDVQRALDKDRDSFNKLKKAIKKAKETKATERVERVCKFGKGISGVISTVASVAKKAAVSEKVAASLLKLGRTARFAGHGVVFIALPIDIIFFVKDVIDLKKGNISKAADEINKLADSLEKEIDDILADC